jgi:hypothetical protein
MWFPKLVVSLLITVPCSLLSQITSDDRLKVQAIADAKFLHAARRADPCISVTSNLIPKTLQIGLSALSKLNDFRRARPAPSTDIGPDRESLRLIDEVPEHCYGRSIALKSQGR